MLAGFFHIFVRCNDPPMKNIRFGLCIPACLFALFCSQQASPQGYVKLNVPYALVGVVNPAAISRSITGAGTWGQTSA